MSCLDILKRMIFIGWRKRIFFIFIIYLSLLLLGGFLFTVLEKEDGAQNTVDSRLTFKMLSALKEENVSDESILATFNQKHLEMKGERPWRDIYGEKVFFSLVLITTIGYGNVVPESRLGKLACIVYFLFGIPLNLIMMRLLVFKFKSGLVSFMHQAEKISDSEETHLLAHLFGCIYFFSFTVVFLLAPAAVFGHLEDWTYSQSVYFSFISLATIGFGDYVAGFPLEYNHSFYYPVYIMIMFSWVLFGVSYVTMTLNLLSKCFKVFIFDKLENGCQKRDASRKYDTSIHQYVSELNKKLIRFMPQTFMNKQIFEDLLSQNVVNSNDLTEDMILKLLEASEDLRDKVHQEIEAINSAMPFQTRSVQTLNVAEEFEAQSVQTAASIPPVSSSDTKEIRPSDTGHQEISSSTSIKDEKEK